MLSDNGRLKKGQATDLLLKELGGSRNMRCCIIKERAGSKRASEGGGEPARDLGAMEIVEEAP